MRPNGESDMNIVLQLEVKRAMSDSDWMHSSLQIVFARTFRQTALAEYRKVEYYGWRTSLE